MSSSFVRTAIALLLGSASVLSQAASVNLSHWAFGNSWGNTVSVGSPDHTGPAGGFKGKVEFADGGELDFTGKLMDFITYCVEIEESFRLPSGKLNGYEVVAGADYDNWGEGDATLAEGIARRLGQLLTYVGSNSTLVDTASESTSLQLAIWNVIYDDDDTLTSGSFREKSGSSYNSYANTLLTASVGWTSTLDVFVLTKSGSQDFLLTRASAPSITSTVTDASPVPEPASLALALLGLGVAGATSRRRRG